MSVRLPRGLAVRVFLTVWVTYLVHFSPTHVGAIRFVCLTEAVVEHHEIMLDHVETFGNGDVLPFGGHEYCNTNPGVGFLAVPFWTVTRWAIAKGGPAVILRDPSVAFFVAHLVATATVTTALMALSAVALAQFVFARTRSVLRAILAAGVSAFGTIAFHFGTHLNQNVVVAALCVLSFVLFFEPDCLGWRRGRLQLLSIGLLLGIAVFADFSALPFAGVLAVVALYRFRTTPLRLGWIVAGALPALAGLSLYLWSAFGRPFTPPQAYYEIAGHTGVFALVTSFSLTRLIDQVFLTRVGLIPFMPFTILSFAYLPGRYRRLLEMRTDEWLTVLSVVAAYLFYVLGNASAIFSQFGPRYLMPAIPFLVLVFAISVPRKHAPVAAALVAASVLINWTGAMLGHGIDDVTQAIGLLLTKGPWLPVMDWLAKPELGAVGRIPHALSPLGLFVFLLFALAAIWGSWPFTRLRQAR